MKLNFLYGNLQNLRLNRILCNYVACRVFNREHDFGPCGSIGVLQGDRLLGVVVFHNWLPEYGIIELSAAADSPKWLCRRSIKEIMTICFEQHGCQQVVSRMAIENTRAIQIYDFLGFDTIVLPNMRGSGKHEHLKLLTKEKWAAHRLNKVHQNEQERTKTP